MASPRSLNIPKELDPAIEQLVHLDDADFVQLEHVLGEVQPALSRVSFASSVAASFGDDSQRIKNVVQFLITLYVVRESATTPIDESQFVEDVCSSIQTKNNPSLNPIDDDWDTFKDKLRRLMSFEHSIGITAKAYTVMSQHERTFCNGTRIATDIRPVFSKDVKEKPTAALIIHTLKLCFHKDDATEDFFVALDSSDVKQLRELLDRAEEKARSLQSVLDDAHMQYLGEEV